MQNFNPYLTSVGQNIYENPFFIAFVNGEDDANSYLIQAGKTGLLFDFNLGKFWIKETSMNGLPKPMRTFSFNEETPRAKHDKTENNTVSREEFAMLTQSVSALSDSVNKLLVDLGGESE